MSYTPTATLALPYEEAVSATRAALTALARPSEEN